MGIQSHNHQIFSGLSPAFIDRLKSHASRATFRKGRVLFKQGATASHFFTLIKGHVGLCIGRRGNLFYKVAQENEGFGWSSLTGGNSYTASAVCIADTAVLRFEAKKLKTLLAAKSIENLRFYQNLSHTLDRRIQKSADLLSYISDISKQKHQQTEPQRDRFDLL